MRAILISIKPEWVAKILNGKKTLEIRKTCPEIFKHLKPYEGCKIDVYIYCTKGKNLMGKFGDGLYHEETNDSCWAGGCSWNLPKQYLNGKVVAKFTLNKVEEMDYYYNTRTLDSSDVLKKSCLSDFEMSSYVGDKPSYAWHINNLEIFDKPKEISEFWNKRERMFVNGKMLYDHKFHLTRAPQSWCYVEGL